jgi:hypothetical protein
MAYSITVDQSAILDGQNIDAADVNTPITNLKTAVQDLGNAVGGPEQFRLVQIATPANPAASSDKLYFKSDDLLYRLTSAGVESAVGPYTLPTQAMVINTTRTVVGSPVASVTISSIPGTYQHLMLVLEIRTDNAAANDSLILRFNADATAANYYTQYSVASAAANTVAEVLGAASTGILLNNAGVGNTGSAGNGHAVIFIKNYASTTMRRTVTYQSYIHGGNTTGLLKMTVGGGDWTNTTNAITSLTFLPNAGTNISANSAYELYGYN